MFEQEGDTLRGVGFAVEVEHLSALVQVAEAALQGLPVELDFVGEGRQFGALQQCAVYAFGCGLEILLPQFTQFTGGQQAFGIEADGGFLKVLVLAAGVEVGGGDFVGALRLEGFGGFPCFVAVGFAPAQGLLQPCFDGIFPEADEVVLPDGRCGAVFFEGLAEKRTRLFARAVEGFGVVLPRAEEVV